MNKRKLLAISVVAIAIAAAAWTWARRDDKADTALTLYGNVELRQVELAFDDAGRIASVQAEEGQAVKTGQVLATLDTARLGDKLDEARAQRRAAAESLRRLRNGTRPEEIAQARAGVGAAEADADYARRQLDRLAGIGQDSGGRAVSQRDVEAARAAQAVALAKLESARKSLALATLGPRAEDIAQAAASVDVQDARIALLERQQADAALKSPSDAIVRSRLMEPGEMASPQRPVFSLAIASPKWIRAYVPETELGRLRPGMPARVTTDSHPGDAIAGQLGFISPSAEFTPKTVQTADLRTALVYEIRILVDDPQDRLRQGMPATVMLDAGTRDGARRE